MKDVHKALLVVVLLGTAALMWLVWRDHTAIGNEVANGAAQVGSAFDQIVYPVKSSSNPFISKIGNAIAKPIDYLTASIVGGLYSTNTPSTAVAGTAALTLGGL